MPALPSMMIGSVAMALVLQGPANLQLSPDAKVASPLAVAKGTTIPVQLLSRISTKTIKEGDNVYTQTIFPITVNNQIVIPVGSSIRGKITKVETLTQGKTVTYEAALVSKSGKKSEVVVAADGTTPPK